MKRSAGVTAAAVLAVLGSACVAFSAVIGFFGMLFASRFGSAATTLPDQGPMPMVAVAVMSSLFNLGFAGWGLATGIGLFRLKPWSRISTLVFAGFMGVGAAFAALLFLFIPLPATPNAGPGSDFIIRVMVGSFCAIPLSIAVWWLVFFTRKSVVAQFSAPAYTTTSPVAQAVIPPPTFVPGPPRLQRPILLTVVAWFYLASVITSVPWYFVGLFRKIPFPFFGTMLEGRGVTIYLALSSGLLLAAGIGLLQNRIWGYWLAIGTQLFGFLNIGANILLPGRTDRLERYLSSFPFRFPPEMPAPSVNYFGMLMILGLAGGMIFSAVLLWFMWACRRSFFEFVAIQGRSVHISE